MAKTYNHLYPHIASFEEQARRGKWYTAAAFECNLDVELLALDRELLAET